MRKTTMLLLVTIVLAGTGATLAQGLGGDPVFGVGLSADRQPLVAGEPYRLLVELQVDAGWHVNTNDPGDEFAVPTAVEWTLPEGWEAPRMAWPEGQAIKFDFSEKPLAVWEGTVVLTASGVVPAGFTGPAEFGVTVTAQACNNTTCLPPTPVTAALRTEVAPAGTPSRILVEAPAVPREVDPGEAGPPGDDDSVSRLAGAALPLQLLIVFLAGLALNLTPCVYPLIPITIGFFSAQAKEGRGGTFGLALVYVLGMSVTYSVLGVVAALTGRILGTALQSPVVILGIVTVLLALALSMFGLWEIRVPGWAMRASGGRGGYFGALVMGFIVGFVAAPCIGPFVLGLLTYVGQAGSPFLGFVLFFALAMGLGLPYLVLGTFTGALNKMPASGAWMIGVRKVFGVLLVALAAYFARPLMSDTTAAWLMGAVLIVGALYMLVVDRTGHEQPAIDRVMRLAAAAILVAGVWHLPPVSGGQHGGELTWEAFQKEAVASAVDSGQPVIVDFFADWCAPCKELDEKTFGDARVAARLGDFARFKVDMTRTSPGNQALAAEYGVRGVPTVIVYHGGKEAFRITGYEPPERFLERLDRVGDPE